MSVQKYAVNQHLIETLLTWVKSGEIAIPEIQRPFVWDATQVRDLLDSLYQGFPVGYIIVWKNPDVKLKDGSLSAGKKVLIDGQQRITALSAALVGQSVVTKEYKTTRIQIAFNPITESFEVSNPAIRQDVTWIPDIAPVMDGQIGLLKLIRQYKESNPDADEDRLENVFTQLIGITKKQIGLIELGADLDIETVTEIFIRINREGQQLSQADFAMSKIAANESYGGNTLRKAIDYFCHLAVAPEFFNHIKENDTDFAGTSYFRAMSWLRDENDDLYDPSYSDMLRVAFTSRFSRGRFADLVALLSGRNFETRTFEDEIAADAFARLEAGVMDFINETHFKRFVMIIKSAGFVVSRLVPSQAPLNFAYVLFLKLRAESYRPEDIERYVRRWFVMSLLTGRYSSSMESQFDRDIGEIDARGCGDYLKTIEDGEIAGDAFWGARMPQNLTTSNSRNPAFLTFLAALARDGTPGFLSEAIGVRELLEHRGDLHHIFPRDYLKKQLRLTQARYNQVANYVYTQQETNIAIGNKPPAVYMADVVRQCETGQTVYGGITSLDALRRNLAQNAVPEVLLEPDVGDYDAFLDARRELMARRIRDYYFSL